MTVAELFQSIRRKKQAVAVDTFRPYRSLLVDIASGKTVDPDHAESVIDAANKTEAELSKVAGFDAQLAAVNAELKKLIAKKLIP